MNLISGSEDPLINVNDLGIPLSDSQFWVVGASRGKMPLESNGVGINSRRVHAESVVSAFQHPTYTTNFWSLHLILWE